LAGGYCAGVVRVEKKPQNDGKKNPIGYERMEGSYVEIRRSLSITSSIVNFSLLVV
jgi:hypothetical protein